MPDQHQQAETIEQVRERLSTVIDPEVGRGIVDMGLIYRIEARPAGGLYIVMTTTTRGCPASAFLTEAVRACAASVPGVTGVDVELTYDPPWTPSMMSP
ncbi:metal-sulfur cluster assembly factor [Rhizobium puerariae]|uniref:Metal-sulfur cluster assembly factor n=1 Tax=Rhizobium puerariae TaxID=1585791 RepID=A0ABV6AE07_9HYPH